MNQKKTLSVDYLWTYKVPILLVFYKTFYLNLHFVLSYTRSQFSRRQWMDQNAPPFRCTGSGVCVGGGMGHVDGDFNAVHTVVYECL